MIHFRSESSNILGSVKVRAEERHDNYHTKPKADWARKGRREKRWEIRTASVYNEWPHKARSHAHNPTIDRGFNSLKCHNPSPCLSRASRASNNYIIQDTPHWRQSTQKNNVEKLKISICQQIFLFPSLESGNQALRTTASISRAGQLSS